MRPLAVRRDGGYHDETPDAENPSATAVRAQLEQGGTWRQLVPQTAAAVYADAARYSMRAGERAVLARLRGLTREEWARVPFGSEGLWSKVWRAVQTEASVEAILCAAKSKRYPRTRLQRLLLCAYLGIDAQTLLREAPYVRVLAFDEKGRTLLREMRKNGGLPIVNAGERGPDAEYFALECRCAALYGLFSENPAETNGVPEEKIRIFQRKN